MLILTAFGICILFLIQFIIYKKADTGSIKKFIKSEALLNVLKEFFVILLGVTLALNFTVVSEEKETIESVIKLLEVVESNIKTDHYYISSLLSEYDKKTMDAQTVKMNTRYNDSLIAGLMENETVMVTFSSLMYSTLISDVKNLELSYEHVLETNEEDGIINNIESMKFHIENILWILDNEVKHLEGIYSEEEVHILYSDYIFKKYGTIEES